MFLGSIVFEIFFGIPGLGDYVIEAINGQDFAVVHVMVFLGSLLYILAYLATDIAYTFADPQSPACLKFVFLWTDFVSVAGRSRCSGVHLARAAQRTHARELAQVLRDAPAMCAAVVLGVFITIALLDSVHFRPRAGGDRGRGRGCAGWPMPRGPFRSSTR